MSNKITMYSYDNHDLITQRFRNKFSSRNNV